MKILGFLLIGISSIICGISYSGTKRSRIADLESFCNMLDLMHAELKNKLSPIPELVFILSEKSQGLARVFSRILYLNLGALGDKSFSDIWSESFDACTHSFKDSECDAIKTLGGILGRYDESLQCSSLQQTVSVLRNSLKKERTEFPQFKKLSIGVSMSMGALLGILLV